MKRKKINILVAESDVYFANTMYLSLKKAAKYADVVVTSKTNEFFQCAKVLNPDIIFFSYAGIKDFSGLDALAYAQEHALLLRLVLIFDSITCEQVEQTVASSIAGYINKKDTNGLDKNLKSFIKNALERQDQGTTYNNLNQTTLNFIHELIVTSRMQRKSCKDIHRHLAECRI